MTAKKIAKSQTCTKCETNKKATSFYKDSSRPSGLGIWCKACRLEHLPARKKKAKASEAEAAK